MERLSCGHLTGDAWKRCRPCGLVGCKWSLYLDVKPDTGAIVLNFPSLEPWELLHSCALDEADRGGLTLERVGELTNLTRERIRQVEVKASIKLAAALREQQGE